MCKYCEGSYYESNPDKRRRLIATFNSEKGGTAGSESTNGCEWSIFIDEEANNKLSFICGPDSSFDSNNGIDVEYQGWAQIMYCPMCGRLLQPNKPIVTEYDELLNWLENYAGVNNDVITFALTNNGDNLETLETVLYWAEGLRNLDQVKQAYPEDFE